MSIQPGRPVREDYEYERCGVYNIFMASEPLAGKRFVKVTERTTKQDWAIFLEDIASRYTYTEKITLVMDNLNIHSAGSLYKTFIPTKALKLREKFEFIFTPKHGIWLNMAEIELNVLTKQSLSWRMKSVEEMRKAVNCWQTSRNTLGAKIDWRFTSNQVRIKIKTLLSDTYRMTKHWDYG